MTYKKWFMLEKLKQLRKEKGLTQKELQGLCGIRSRVISDFENGYRNPGIGSLKKLAEALDVAVDYFLKEH